MKKETIHRKDGVSYERKRVQKKYNSFLNIRISQSTIEDLKEIAEKKGAKYNTLARNILEEYIQKYKTKGE